MECIHCGDRLNKDGVCENCGWVFGEEEPTPTPVTAATEGGGEISFAPPQMKKCPSCNAECTDGSKFCPECGHSFTGARAQGEVSDFAAATNPFGGSAGQSFGKQPAAQPSSSASSSSSSASSTRRCVHCGKSVDKSSVYCSYCGKLCFSAPKTTARYASTSSTSTSTSSYSSSTSSSSSSYSSSYSYSKPKKRRNGFAAAGFWLSFFGWVYFAWIPGLILSKKGIEYANYNGGVGKGLAVAGRVFGTIWAVITGLFIFVMCAEGL